MHHLALKALAAQDDDCYRLFIDWLPFETSQGRQTARTLREQGGVLRYVDDVAQYHQMEKVAAAQGFTLVNAGYVYEAELLARIPEVYPDVELQRMEPEALLLDFEELSADEQESMQELMDAAADVLRPWRCQPEGASSSRRTCRRCTAPGPTPRFLRSLEQSKETADPLFQGVLGSLQSRHVKSPTTRLVLNYQNPLVRRLAGVKARSILDSAIQVLYVQGLLLAHQPLTSRELGILSQGMIGLLDSVIDFCPPSGGPQ